MSLQRQIDDVVNEIVIARRELDDLLGVDEKSDHEWGRVEVLKNEIADMEREVDRARRWLSTCGVTI